MRSSFSILSLIILSLFCNISNLIADTLPIPIDNRMRTLVYSPNEVFRLKFKVGYQSHIVFPPDESPVLQTFGDSRGWSVKLVGTSMFIKPMDPGLSTNMIIETNKDRIYYFEISSTFSSEGEDDDFAYRVNFYYPQKAVDIPEISVNKGIIDGDIGNVNFEKRSGVVVKSDSPLKNDVNFKYSFAGNGEMIKPVKVFDDGKMTYMLFPNKNERVPSIYAVDNNGNEQLLKYKIQNGYVVIDTTEYQFSLRLGSQLICIFNDLAVNSIVVK